MIDGYVLWGHDAKRPEGGMNDKGLFFDAAALPEPISIRKVTGRRDFNGYAVEPVLKRFTTVAQALAYLSNFNLTWQEKAQIFLADASGDAAIVHPNHIIRVARIQILRSPITDWMQIRQPLAGVGN